MGFRHEAAWTSNSFLGATERRELKGATTEKDVGKVIASVSLSKLLQDIKAYAIHSSVARTSLVEGAGQRN